MKSPVMESIGIKCLFRHCQNKVMPALPVKGHDSPLYDLDTVATCGIESIGGFSDGQIGMDDGSLPSFGYSINHSVLTRGILMAIQEKNWRTIGSPPLEPIVMLTSCEQIEWITWETHATGCDEALLSIMVGFAYRPVNVAGLLAYADDTPRFSLCGKPDDYCFQRIKSCAPEFKDAPYAMSFIYHERPECSWAIMHRNPYKVDGMCLASPSFRVQCWR